MTGRHGGQAVGPAHVDGVRVTLLVDNERGSPGLRAQWGLSVWIETPEARILLDSGLNDVFARNARALGIALDEADAFVLSHGHGDHGGGVARAVESAPAAGIVLHPGALSPRYWLSRTGKVDPIGLQDPSLAALWGVTERVTWALGPVEVAPRVWASGPIPRRHPLEEAERNFFLDHACTVRDQVVDDQAVVVETDAGLVLLLGCAHAGVVNTLDHVRRTAAAREEARPGASATGRVAGDRRAPRAGNRRLPLAGDCLPRVRAVVGGMHLLHASPARLRATSDALRAAGVDLVAPVHCTGKRGKRHLRATLPDAYADCATGSVLEFD